VSRTEFTHPHRSGGGESTRNRRAGGRGNEEKNVASYLHRTEIRVTVVPLRTLTRPRTPSILKGVKDRKEINKKLSQTCKTRRKNLRNEPSPRLKSPKI